mgnify:CR=1 FL=1
METAELYIFKVFYKADEGIRGCGIDYATVRAEDEDHALDKFLEFYPDEEVTEIECCGSAF